MKRFLRGLGIFLALIGVGIISAFAVVALLLRQEEVRVPDFTGQDIVTLIEVLNQQGLQLKVDGRETSATLPRDTVISQVPSPGSGIKKGRHVRVVISLGPSEMQTPPVTGEQFRKADVMIRQAGFFPGTIARVSSGRVERDVVITQDPRAGSPLDKGGRINLLVSSGKKQQTMIMPRLTGRRAEEAASLIERMGLQRRIVYRPAGSAGQPVERVVVLQKPAPGAPVLPNATVEIVVNK